ncbi:MAG: Sec-independent protein translocase protein TatB [Gammaproteobacteria bacterium]
MFQIGFPELLTLLVLMLLLVGPKRLPEVTKFFIQIGSKFRSQYEKISNEINNEIGTEEIKKDIFNDMKLQELELEENEDNDGGK